MGRRLRSPSERALEGALMGLKHTAQRGSETWLDEQELEPQLVRPEVLPEDILLALKDIKAAG